MIDEVSEYIETSDSNLNIINNFGDEGLLQILLNVSVHVILLV